MESNQSLEHISTELLLDYIEGLLSPAARHRVELALGAQEELRVMEAGARFLFVEEGRSREEVEQWLYTSLPDIPIEDAIEAELDIDFSSRMAPAAVGAYMREEEAIYIGSKAARATPRLWMPIAAAILFFVMGGGLAWYLIPGVSPERLAMGYLEEPYGGSQLMRGKSENPAWEEAMAAYYAMSYAEAEAMFEAIAAQEQSNLIIQASFYQALSQLYSTDPDYAAIARLLAEVQESGSEAYEQQARWYQSLALILDGKAKDALPLLETIVADEDHFRNAQASVMLRTLR